MANPRASQHRQSRRACWPRVAIPLEKPPHLDRNRRGGRCLEMHFRVVQRSRDHLHRIAVFTINAAGQIASSVHQQRVPVQKPRLVQWRLGFPVKFHHQFRNPLLRRRNPAVVRRQSELPPDRRLHALAIQDFPLDLRSLQRLLAHQLRHQQILAVLFQMFHRPPIDPRFLQKPLLQRSQTPRIKTKIRPIVLLPIPKFQSRHEL